MLRLILDSEVNKGVLYSLSLIVRNKLIEQYEIIILLIVWWHKESWRHILNKIFSEI